MNAPPAPDFVGALLAGRYRVVRAIGRGGMGAVYEGVQEDLGRRVAIKVLHPHLSVNADHVERFRREAQAAAALGHPNIVQITDCQWMRGEPLFLVMELLAGASLGQVIQAQGIVPPARATFIATQVLGALAAAHRAGIVHRDVKPDNIFLTSTAAVHDFVKVLDFGVAKLLGQGPDAALTTTGMAIGTPYYMAPEQARGRAVDPRTDIYAVGVVLYHAMSGRLPFAGTSFNELMFAIAEQTAPSLSALRGDLDPRLAQIVERAMAKDPVHRFQSADEMAAALAPWARASSSMQPPPPMAIADPTAPTMQAFGGTYNSARPPVAGSAPPPGALVPSGKRTSALPWTIGALLAVLALIVVAANVVPILLPHDNKTYVATADAAVAAADAATGVQPMGGGTSLEDAGHVAPGGTSARRDAGALPVAVLDASAPPSPSNATSADASTPPPARTLKPSSYLSMINVVGMTYELDQVKAAVNPLIGAANACFATTRLSDLNPTFEYRLTAAGQVAGISVRGAPAADTALVNCAASKLAGARFPPNPKKVADSVVIALAVRYPE